MNIRVKKSYIDWNKKKELKKWGFTIKYDRKWKVYNLTLPSNIQLVNFHNTILYFLFTDTGRHLGSTFNPFEQDGGSLTFVP